MQWEIDNFFTSTTKFYLLSSAAVCQNSWAVSILSVWKSNFDSQLFLIYWFFAELSCCSLDEISLIFMIHLWTFDCISGARVPPGDWEIAKTKSWHSIVKHRSFFYSWLQNWLLMQCLLALDFMEQIGQILRRRSHQIFLFFFTHHWSPQSWL